MLPFRKSLQYGFSQLGLLIGLIVVGAAVVILIKSDIYKGKSEPIAQQPNKIFKIRTTLAKATPSEPQMLIIKKYNLDKKNGLDIEYVDSNPGDAEREFFAGNFKIILSGTLSSFTAHLKNIPILIAAPAINVPYLILVPKDSPIKTLKDLKGKKFGTLPKITASYTSTTTVLRSAGIDPEKDMQIVFVNPAQVGELLSKGEVDSGIVVAPIAYAMIASGKYRSIADLEQVWEEKEDGLPLPFVPIAVRGDWYKENPDNKEITRRFIKTFNDAAVLIQEDPKILGGLTDYIKTYHLDNPESMKLMEEQYPRLLHKNVEQKGYDGLKRLYERAKQYGVIPNNVPAFEEVVLLPAELGF